MPEQYDHHKPSESECVDNASKPTSISDISKHNEPQSDISDIRLQFAENARQIDELTKMKEEMEKAHVENAQRIQSLHKIQEDIKEKMVRKQLGISSTTEPGPPLMALTAEKLQTTSDSMDQDREESDSDYIQQSRYMEGYHATVPSRDIIGRPIDNVECNKAYKNMDFMSTPAARNIRIQCEFQEPGLRLAEQGVHNVVMFFGSARAKSRESFDQAISKITPNTPEYDRLKKTEFLVRHYENVRELAKRFTAWSMNRCAQTKANYLVATGGGPGMMQAANEGAWLAGGRSVGFGISLPFEKGLNPYVTEDLAFEFHYFFTRKFWMAYKITGLLVAPGGFGTLDELFELLTLKQTGKIKRPIPVVLFGGESYWKHVLNLDKMCEFGMISQNDIDEICCTDDIDVALKHMIACIEEFESEVIENTENDSSPSSPFVAPMVDPHSGAYVRDERGRVCKKRTSHVEGVPNFGYGAGAMSAKDCKSEVSESIASQSPTKSKGTSKNCEDPHKNLKEIINGLKSGVTSEQAGSKRDAHPEESIV